MSIGINLRMAIEALEELAESRIWEDDSNEEFLLFWCRECDTNARDDAARMVHDDDCPVGKAFAVLARAKGVLE